jgi:hypothetical protein
MKKFILEEINKPKRFFTKGQNEIFLKQVILGEQLGMLFGIKESFLAGEGNPMRITISVFTYQKSQIFRIIQLEDRITGLIHKIPRETLAVLAKSSTDFSEYMRLISLLNVPKETLLNPPHNFVGKYEKILPYSYNYKFNSPYNPNFYPHINSLVYIDENKLNVLDAYAITKGYLDIAEFNANAIPIRKPDSVNWKPSEHPHPFEIFYYLFYGIIEEVQIIDFIQQGKYYLTTLLSHFPFNHMHDLNFLLCPKHEHNLYVEYLFYFFHMLIMTKPYIHIPFQQACTLNELESKMKLIHELLLQYIDNDAK